MPPLEEAQATPFHELPYPEILGRLRGLTNLRVVPDEGSGTAYKVEIGPFPGWQKTPGLVRDRSPSATIGTRALERILAP
jgi:hypothetical protein